MSNHGSSSHSPAGHGEETNTPKVTGSSIWWTISGVLFVVVLIWAISIGASTSPQVYDLRDVGHGATLSFDIEPGKTARVYFEWNGLTPAMWSSEPIEAVTAEGRVSILSGNIFVSKGGGVETSSWEFRNKGENVVQVKLAQCGASEPCKADFPPPSSHSKIITESEIGGFTRNTAWFVGFFVLMMFASWLMHTFEIEGSSFVSLLVGLCTIFFFGARFLGRIASHEVGFWPFLFLLASIAFIGFGGRKVGFKTMTGAYSRFTGERVAHHANLKTGTHWINPLFEHLTVTPDGEEGTAIDMQKIAFEIEGVPLSQTAVRGIQARVLDIAFSLQLAGDEEEIQDIEGGVTTIKSKIGKFVEAFFRRKIGEEKPTDIDTDKGGLLERWGRELSTEVASFCERSHYPYAVVDPVIIGDTELEPSYYAAAAAAAKAGLLGEATMVEAGVVLKIGKMLRPNGTEKEQLEAGQLQLKLVTKVITEGSGTNIGLRHQV